MTEEQIKDLKSAAYDTLARIQMLQSELAKINEAISTHYSKQPAESSEEVVEAEEETK